MSILKKLPGPVLIFIGAICLSFGGSIVKSFEGVANAYAIQAGREVRVIVDPEKISDEEATLLAKEIAKRLDKEIDFPAQIKITVIRETRHIEYAKS